MRWLKTSINKKHGGKESTTGGLRRERVRSKRGERLGS